MQRKNIYFNKITKKRYETRGRKNMAILNVTDIYHLNIKRYRIIKCKDTACNVSSCTSCSAPNPRKINVYETLIILWFRMIRVVGSQERHNGIDVLFKIRLFFSLSIIESKACFVKENWTLLYAHILFEIKLKR